MRCSKLFRKVKRQKNLQEIAVIRRFETEMLLVNGSQPVHLCGIGMVQAQ